MLDPQAECPMCGHRLGASPSCQGCGWKPTAEPGSVPLWQNPLAGKRRTYATDVCDAPECEGVEKHQIRKHIEEFRAITQRPDTVFTRPSFREVPKVEISEDELEARRARLREQAAKLLAGDDPVPF